MTDKRIRIILDSRQAKQNADELNKSTTAVGKSADNAQFSMNKLATAIAAVLATRKVAEYADAWTRVENQLRRTTSSQEDLAATSAALLNVANSTRAALEPTVELYTSLTVATRDLGVSQAQITGVTKTINNLFLESGKGASETAGAIRQLGQALESGALRGDEFNSVAEGAPGILRAVQDQTGLTRGELRELAAQGEITAELLVASLTNYEDKAQSAADKTQATLGQALDVAGNNLTYFVGRLNTATGASDGFANAIISISNAIANPKILDNFEAFGKLIGIGIGQTVQRVSAELRYFGKIIANPFDGESRAQAWDEFQEDVRNIGRLTSESIDLLVAEKEAIQQVERARASAGSAGFSSSPGLPGATGGDREVESSRAITAALQAELDARTEAAQIYRDTLFNADATLYQKQIAQIQLRESEQLFAVEQRLITETQRKEEALARQLESEKISNENKLLLQEEFDQQTLLLKQNYESEKTRIEEEAVAAREALREAEKQSAINTALGLAGQVLTLTQNSNKKAFEISKKAALASAVVSGYRSATDAWSAGMSTGGPYAPLVAAAYTAASLLKTGGLIKSIQSQKFGGGGASQSAGGGGAPSIGGVGGGAAPTTASSLEIPQQKRIIDLRGVAATDRLTVAQFAELMEQDGAIVTLENARIDAERRNVIGVSGR